MKTLYADNERRLLRALTATLGDRLSEGQIDWVATIHLARRYRVQNPDDYDRRLNRYLRRIERLVARKARTDDERRSQIAALENIANVLAHPAPGRARRKGTTASRPQADLRPLADSRSVSRQPSRLDRQDMVAL